MSWASIANNQTVSFNNLQDAVNNGVFAPKVSIPVSNEQITKTDANTYVYIDTAYGPYASKASNQLVVKSNLQAVTYFYLSYSTDGFAAACSAYPTISIYYASYGSTLQNGTTIYTDVGLTNPAPAGYYSNGISSWQITSGGLAGTFYNETACSSPIVCYEWTIYNGSGVQIEATWTDCETGNFAAEIIDSGNQIVVCSRTEPTAGGGTVTGGTVQCT